MSAPGIETPRLILRAHVLEDFPAYAAMWADPVATRHIGDGDPRSEEFAWQSFLAHAGRWQLLGFGSWIVEEKSGGNFVGIVGFSKRKREGYPALDNAPEMGWMFATTASGKGYATEAVGAAIDWGRSHFGTVRAIAIVAPDNAASMRVAEKCGFKEFHRGPSAGRPRVFCDRVL
jgi:RimJ/RimL family protein N-acetyltransferase